MSAYLLVIRDRAGKAVEMDIYSGEALTIGLNFRSNRAPKPYAAIEDRPYSEARTLIIANMLTDTTPWPEELQPFVDRMLAPLREGDPYREPAPADAVRVIEVEAPISNYYGAPTLRGSRGEWMLVLDDYSGEHSVTVSAAFAAAWRAEFGKRRNGLE